MKKRIILFGAGKYGKNALNKYGKENVAFFADNSEEKQGTYVEGIEVISFSKMLQLHEEGYVIIITLANPAFLIGQLELSGINDFLVFRSDERINYIETLKKYEEDYKENNLLLDMYAYRSQKEDIIENCSEFKELVKDVMKKNKEQGISLYKHGVEGEGQVYGNLKGLLDFAELPNDAYIFFPTVSHQDCFPLYTPAFLYKSAVVFSGDYYKKKVHERAPYVPVFSVGPYIHYAKGIYEQEKVKKIKEKNGKTLLVFLPHSIENVKRLYDKKHFIDKILSLYGNRFNFIMMCVYWADINDPVCDYALERGIRIVSAGFRFDPKFDSRLRTIIELADAVACGDIGTHIAYSLCLGKPIARISITDNQKIADAEIHSNLEKILQFSDDHKEFDKGFFEFFNTEIRITDEQKTWMNPVSGFDQIRKKNYIQNIYKISKDIWLECEGNTEKYPGAVQTVYQRYEKQLDLERLCMLKEAVGAFLD